MWKTLPEIAEANGVNVLEVLRESINQNLPIYKIGYNGKPYKGAEPGSTKGDLLATGHSFDRGSLLEVGRYLMYDADAEKAWPSASKDQKFSSYSTPYLLVLKAAIEEFFYPRKDVDAKKEEVVEWIKAKALSVGLPESDNIAGAIFTIIKPTDHDPKRRKG